MPPTMTDIELDTSTGSRAARRAHASLPESVACRIAAAVPCCLRTIRRYVRGERQHVMTTERIETVLRELGLGHHVRARSEDSAA